MKRIALMAVVLVASTGCSKQAPSVATGRVDSTPSLPAGPPTFTAFQTSDTLAGPPAAPDYEADSTPPRLREIIGDAVQARPNFAGVFSIVTWGCGTQCRSHVILDRRTGRMIDDTLLDFSCHEPDFRLNSTLVV